MHTCRRRAPTYRALVGGDHLDRPRAASADDVRQRRSGLVVDHLRERAGRAPAAGHGSERPSSRSSRRDRYHGARSTTAPPGRGSDAPWLLLVERDNANSGEPRARNPSQSISDGGSAAGRRSGELRCDTRHQQRPALLSGVLPRSRVGAARLHAQSSMTPGGVRGAFPPSCDAAAVARSPARVVRAWARNTAAAPSATSMIRKVNSRSVAVFDNTRAGRRRRVCAGVGADRSRALACSLIGA